MVGGGTPTGLENIAFLNNAAPQSSLPWRPDTHAAPSPIMTCIRRWGLPGAPGESFLGHPGTWRDGLRAFLWALGEKRREPARRVCTRPGLEGSRREGGTEEVGGGGDRR